jgi:prepilin-type N-terminal cleavage/methylation domain-containing protein
MPVAASRMHHMLHKLRTRVESERGFTLIELMWTILIIGILTSIALAIFLGQQQKGEDASALSEARNALSQIETCFTDEETYVGCDDTTLAKAGLDTSEVKVTGQSVDGYTVIATSKTGNVFKAVKRPSGGIAKTCTTTGKAGCLSSGTW